MAFKGAFKGALSGAFGDVSGGGEVPVFGPQSFTVTETESATFHFVTLPEGLQEGDLLLWIHSQDGGAASTPNDMTLFYTSTYNTTGFNIFAKTVDAAFLTDTNRFINFGGSEGAVSILIRVPFGDFNDIRTTRSTTTSTGNVSRTIPFTSVVEGMLMLAFAGHDNPDQTFTTTPETGDGYTLLASGKSKTPDSSTTQVGLKIWWKYAEVGGVSLATNFQQDGPASMHFGVIYFNPVA